MTRLKDPNLKVSLSKIEKQLYKRLDMRRRGHGIRFDLPSFNIRTSGADIAGRMVIESYSVGQSMVYITEKYDYLVQDPVLTPDEQQKLDETSSKLLFLLPSSAIRDEKEFEECLAKMELRDDRLNYFLKREVFGYGVLEPLAMDPMVEDVIIASPDSPVTCVHSSYGAMPTNITFTNVELDRFIERLAILAGRSASPLRPLIDTRFSHGFRFSAAYGQEISPNGSNFMMHKIPEKPWSITSLMLLNTIPPEMAAWLMLIMENRKAFLVTGAIGSGKTSMINALCNLVPERSIIVTAEDMAELRLAHHNRFSFVARRSPIINQKEELGMFPLVNEALNMPADYIFMGDLWGEEAKLWFHEIMAGRGGASSLHAEDSQAAVKMLLSPPMQVDEGAIESLSSIVVMGKFVLKSKGKIVQRRRAINLFDLGPDSTQTSLFRYDLETDSFSFNECSIMESNSAIRMLGGSGLSENALLDQYLKRVSFLRRLMEISKLRPEFREFSAATSAVWDFQASPDDFNPDSLVLSEDDDLNSRERIENQHCMAEGSPRSLLSSTHANFQKSLDMQPAQHAEKDKQLPTQNASALLPIAASASLPMSSAERTGSQSELNAENDDMPAWIRKVSSN